MKRSRSKDKKKRIINIGVDIGSTTVKVLAMDDSKKIVFSSYERHFSDTKKTLYNLLTKVLRQFPNDFFRIAFTGSGSLSLSKFLNITFVQEVIACREAVLNYPKKVDVAIELGGEDAKIIYFTGGIEQRMNGSCAGGTGSFLDQMAILLNTDTEGLNELARKGSVIYPIASRCGVFAKTDVQPLINDGAKKEDIALSIMQAVVNQTISGLACGKPIKGNVIFLGGPLNYLDTLKERFKITLNLSDDAAISPKDAHLFVAGGALFSNMNVKPINAKMLAKKVEMIGRFKEEATLALDPLFETEEDYKEFLDRHSREKVETKPIKDYEGDIFIGIDAGSTTLKLVCIDKSKNIIYSKYASNEGNPVLNIKKILEEFYKEKNPKAKIRFASSTGYGELLIKKAFNLDSSEIETVAHYTAAHEFLNDVDSIIDIGGQDMKYIKIKDGQIDTIMLNEACSSGCGSFIETLTKSLSMPIDSFVELAVHSKMPVDLGTRCTVFMNSKIKQMQKESRTLGDIFAGLSYSIVKNALLKVMKMRNTDDLGDNIVVQGGTFLNDAVLRAFEKITNKNVIRPNIAGIMGAYGMALISLNSYNEKEDKTYESTISKPEELANFKMNTSTVRCKGCTNNCSLTINNFNGKKYISGNRCEKGAGNTSVKNELPNMFEYKYNRLFNYYVPLEEEKAERGIIGIPRVLNMYEDYPFWFTLFTNLGFKVVLSSDSTHKLYEKGIDSIPSESACYPAKIAHGHIIDLIEKGVKTIFYPCMIYGDKEFSSSDNAYNCPMVTSYPEAIRLNVEELEQENITYINPFLPFNKDGLVQRFLEIKEFKKYKFTKKELKNSLDKAFEEEKNFREDIKKKAGEYVGYIDKNGINAIVLAGRPYHLDKEINHGIDKLITSLNLAVLTEDSICYESDDFKRLRVVDQWKYHSRIYRAADAICKHDNMELVNLNSFGCGLDAIITDQTEEILKANGRIYTTVKIDEINNLGAIKIRIRSLIAAMKKRRKEKEYAKYEYQKKLFTKEMKKTHTILCPDISPFHTQFLIDAIASEGYNIVYLSETTDNSVETGLKYVNNDACYPSIIVIGQLIEALKSGKYDLDNTSVIITQTGGGCRATNYIGLIRKALKDAKFENVPVLSLNFSGLEKDQGFKISLPMVNKLLLAVMYGDLLMKLFYETRPYEKVKGTTKEMYDFYFDKCRDNIRNGNIRIFKNNVRNIIRDFDSIPIVKRDIPKVGIVGEILIKYHHYGNNHLADTLEKENMEVVVPELMGFVKYCALDPVIKSDILKTSKADKVIYNTVLDIISWYEKTTKRMLSSTRYRNLCDIKELEENVKDIISVGNQTGEGWFLTSEIVELIKEGVTNIVCVQPFACLPNHIVGKAVIKRIKEIYPDSNIIAIDYDPGSSVTNQVNRISLMVSIAKSNVK